MRLSCAISLAGTFLVQQRNAVLVCGTAKHILRSLYCSQLHSIRLSRQCYKVVDLVNRVEIEARNAGQGRLADHLISMDFVILDELGVIKAGGRRLRSPQRWLLAAHYD
jgi:hypothetical protein